MSLELIRESIKVNQVAGQNTAQTVIENDIIVPDSKPDISNILLADGDVYVNNAEAAQDKILISGTIGYKILYVSDGPDQEIKSINSKAPFAYGLDVPNAAPGMNSKIKCDIEHMEYDILNGRKVNIKTILKASGRAENDNEQNVVCDVEGVEELQVLKNNLSVNTYLGSNNVNTVVNESLDIPSGKPTIKEILRNDVKITGKDVKVSDNKVIAKGDLNISTLYIADDENNSIQFMEHEVPFSQMIDLPEIDENANCNADFVITDTQFEAAEDNDGELRVLNCEVGVEITADAFTRKSVEYIEDAYSPRVGLDLEKEEFSMQEYVADGRSQVVLKDTITIDDGCPDIVEVFNVLCKPGISDYRAAEDRITIEGLVSNRILYLSGSAEEPVYCCEQEIPLKHVVEVRGVKANTGCDIDLDVEHCTYSMVSSREVEIRLTVTVISKVVGQTAVDLISKATDAPLDEKRIAAQPSITIYFTQPGDTLWNIAKRYYTTTADIQKLNDLSDEDLAEPGQQVIIPKKAG